MLLLQKEMNDSASDQGALLLGQLWHHVMEDCGSSNENKREIVQVTPGIVSSLNRDDKHQKSRFHG